MDAEETAAKAEEKTEVLNAFFVSVFNCKTESPQGSWQVREQKRSPAVQESRTDPSNPGGSSQWQGVLMELAEQLTKPVSMLVPGQGCGESTVGTAVT